MPHKEDTIPQVFLSHASEDKDRFARRLAEEFHLNGIKCWFDEWEIHPGDSLFERINKGIHESGYFVVVLSKNSIDKAWVKKELEAGYSKLVSNKVKLIPVILDNLPNDSLPPLLANILHCNFSDLDKFDSEFTKLKNSVLNISIKPPVKLGPSVPQHTQLSESNEQFHNSPKTVQTTLDQNKIMNTSSDFNPRREYFRELLKKYEPYNKNLYEYFMLHSDSKIKPYLSQHITATNANELEEHFKAIFENVGNYIDNGDIYMQNGGAIYLKELKKPLSASMLYNVFRSLVDVSKYQDDKERHPQDVFNRLYLECINIGDYAKQEVEVFYIAMNKMKIKEFKDVLKSKGLNYDTYIS